MRHYKNLAAVRVSLADRNVLYGPNGSGKTNLLEALALIAGTPSTLRNAAHRLSQPEPGAIEIVVSPWDGRGAAETHLSDWWHDRGVFDLPASWAEGIEASCLSDHLKEALLDGSNLGLRYTLVEVSHLEAAGTFDRGRARRDEDKEDNSVPPSIYRGYDVTLCLQLTAIADLKGAASELGVEPPASNDLDDLENCWLDLVPLRPNTILPIGVSWLSRERTDDELWADYEHSITATSFGVERLIKGIAEKLTTLDVPPVGPSDAQWISTKWFADLSHESVRAVLPRLDIDPGDSWLQIGAEAPVGSPGHSSWITQLSSGERFLADQAMFDAEEVMDTYHRRVIAAETFLAALDVDDLQFELLYKDRNPFESSEFWDTGEVHGFLTAIERIVAERHGSSLAEVAFGQPRPLVHLYDEPERHLHSAAQKKRAEQLHNQVTSDQTVVATHSLPFLGRNGWDHFHVLPTPEGTVVDRFNASDTGDLSLVARSLGVTGGELLSRYQYVLYVEGLHDKAFIEETQRDLLRDYAILVMPIHGLDDVVQVADSQLVGRFMDVGTGVLADHSLTKAGTPAPTKESRLLADLRQEAERRGRKVDEFRLRRPDIIAYLPDGIIQQEAPKFPGFKRVEEEWKRRRGSDFKTIATQMAEGFPFTADNVRILARRTAESSFAYPDDLRSFLADLAAAASR